MNTKYIIITVVTAFLATATPGVVLADEIVISGNGTESQSVVTTTQSSSTTVQQSNNADISNTIDANATTGDNSASGNSGQTTITTGDAAVESSVTTQANSSHVDADCCVSGENSASITGNGSNTQNTITINTSVNNTAVVTQYARISNTIQGSAVTGRNTANGNNGNVLITTGDIHLDAKIKNSPINISKIALGRPSSLYDALVSGNGSGSRNEITFSESFDTTIFETNRADILNNVLFDLITGENTADDNNGDVAIVTGDIVAHINITNGPINVNEVTITCCEEKEEEKPITPPTPPTPTPGKGGPSNGGGGGGGSSQGDSGSVGGHILPVTGGSWLFIGFLVSSLMLFLGSVLRLRSGRSPGTAF